MDNKSVCNVYFVGQDYQPISNAAKTMKIMCDEKEYIINADGVICPKDNNDDSVQSDQNKARLIIDAFLDDAAPNGYLKGNSVFVNSSNGKNKKIYDANFGTETDKGYFCGVVGVIRKTISCSVNEDETEKITLKVTLQIKSRLDVDSEGKVSKPYFLSTMLLRDKLTLSNNTIPSSDDEIFDYLLLFWYKEKLQKACLKGYYKTYRRFENNDDRVRGTLDIARHIRLNMGQKNGKIAYSYRENTINNFLNQLIVAAYYHLKNKYYDLVEDNFDGNIELKKVIDYLSNETGFSQVNVKDILKNNLKPIAHPYFTEYEELRLICLRILRDEGISIFDGESGNDTEGILFYLPELWEKFLEDKLIKKALLNGVDVKPQEKVENFGYETDKKYIYTQDTYPDYIFVDNNRKKPFMILDAKCKPKWENAYFGGSVSEVMEDYNKCIRDMVAVNSHATGVIFPMNKNDKKGFLHHRISAYNPVDFFYTIPIQIPFVEKNSSYSDWTNEFEKEIQGEIEVLSEIIQKEFEFAKNNEHVFEQIIPRI